MTAVTPSGEPDATPDAPIGQQDNTQLRRPYQELTAPEKIERWEHLVPGTGERILKLIEHDFEQQEREHQQWCRNQVHQRRMDMANLLLRAVGIIVGSGCLAGYLWIAKHFVDHGAAVPAAGMLSGGVAAIAAVLHANNRKS
ncbi:hypothetical protein [Streptomyces sp. NPDC091215]|uniref:hypothetical protein n=1 Tax=Streptomyces sp. NPDC091215 TaxID=3155192 RepID=UPI0034460DA5